MPRNITLTFDDGSSHVYQNAPDEITPEQVIQRATKDFSGKALANVDGGRGRQPAANESPMGLSTQSPPEEPTRAGMSLGAARAPAAAAGSVPSARPAAPEAGAGRGSVNPPIVDPSAPKPKAPPRPYQDRREALDDAVNLLDEGADRAQVNQSFAGLGIKPEEIEAHGIQRGSQFFQRAPDRAAPAQPAPAGAGADQMSGWEPTAAQGAANLVKRVGARSGQAVTSILRDAGAVTNDGAARLLARDEKRLQAAAPGEAIQVGMQEIGQSKTFGEAAQAMASNPMATATMLAESVLLSAPGLATTLMGLPAKGLAATVGATSGALEYGMSLSEVLQDRGIDLLDSAAVAQALNDRAVVADIRERGAKRGLIVGGIDALTAGIAGKFIAPALQAARAGQLTGTAAKKAVAAGWAKELSSQVAGGAGGESLAQASVGEFKPADILLEGLGEMASAPMEAHSNLQQTAAYDPARQIASEIDAVQLPGQQQAEAAPQQPQPSAWDIARAKGFNVTPPFKTDAPRVYRSKSADMFRDLGAHFGLNPKAVEAAISRAEGLPTAALGGFFQRAAAAFERRGMFGAPVDPDVLAVFNEPVDDPVEVEKAAAAMAKQQKTETPPEYREAMQALDGMTDLAEDAQPAAAIPAVSQGDLASAAAAIVTPVDEAAHQAATSPTNDRPEPTQAQKEAGNYKVGRTRIAGMDIRVENPQGSKRRGVAQDGTPWETEMRAHYGYFAGTEAADGDALDVFIKPGTAEDWRGPVFVIDQVDPKTGELDEHKVIMGAADEAEAEQLYRSNYDADWQGLGAITRLPLPAFKGWAKSGRLKEPLGDIASRPQLAPDRKLPNQQAPAGAGPVGKAGGSRPAPAAQVAAPEANPAPAPADPPKIAGKPVTDIQTGQLLRYSTMQGASERVRQVAAAEVRRRETEAMWAQREQERQAQEAAIVEQSRDQQVTQAVAASLAGEVEAPGAMAEAFTRALQKKQKGKPKNEPVAPQAPAAPTARSEAAQTPRPDQAGASAAADGGQPTGVSGTGGGAAQAAGVKAGRPMPASKTSKASTRARAAQQIDTEKDTMLQALAKLGGLRRDIVASEFGLKPEELKHSVRAGPLKAYPFRKTGGMDLDQAMTALTELGYFDGVSPDDIRTTFEEAIYEEMSGSPRMSTVGAMRQAADAYNADQEQQQEAAELDALAQTEADAEREAIMAEAGIASVELADLPPDAAELAFETQDIASGMRALGFTEEEIADGLARQRKADANSEADHPQDHGATARKAPSPDGAGGAAARVAGGDRRDAGAARREDQGSQGQDGEDLTLSTQTEGDLQAKAAREEAGAKAEKSRRDAELGQLRKEDADKEAKTRADQTVDDFELGQSADDQLSGNKPLFSAIDDAPIFYSELAQQVQRSPMNAGTAGAWGQYLDALAKRGAVKADEIEWTGLREWLAMQPGKVSKAQIAEFLDANGVQVSEVTLAPEESGVAMDDWLEEWADSNTGPTAQAIQEGDSWEGIRAAARAEGRKEILRRLDAKTMPSKYEKWVVPGGKNYREVLLTLPKGKTLDGISKDMGFGGWHGRLTEDQKDQINKAFDAQKIGPTGYKSSHWDQLNVLAHVRVDDRTDADGKRVLFVHEIQSDFGQDFKKTRDAIARAVDNDFQGIVNRMKKAGVLQVECD